MLEKFEKPVIETAKLKPDGTYGMFTLDPLEGGKTLQIRCIEGK